MWHHLAWYKFTDILEEHTASIFNDRKASQAISHQAEIIHFLLA
jgi:hypothetical protein